MRKLDLPLACPCKSKSELLARGDCYTCADHACPHSQIGNAFPIVNGTPVLISELRCDTVCAANSSAIYVKRVSSKYKHVKSLFSGRDAVTEANCDSFLAMTFDSSPHPTVLVIGSGEKGGGTDALWEHPLIEVHGIDIYKTDTVDIICDAHYLPIRPGSYDGVWIQAVLEHVVDPTAVVNEIHRILKPGGVIYAETPFMQQVHEGRYDFTRYTVLGHRYLFKNFDAVHFGGKKGPEFVLAWAVRYLMWSVTRSRTIGRITGILFEILTRPLRHFISLESMHDASSAVFFLGRKHDGPPITHKALVSLYKGQFR
jgi:SAM-dependent methyltransferase